MLSILGKLLCRELGVQKYDMYFSYYCKYINGGEDDIKDHHNEMIFNDIYGQLENKDIYTLHEMLERLLDAVSLSVKISRQYMWVWLGTVLTIIFLIIFPVTLTWTVCGIVLVIMSFGYKSMVYIVNRYCFIDANIILMYKMALYHTILTYNIHKMPKAFG